MDWFLHPAYIQPKKRLIKRFRRRVYILRRSRIRHLVFLCGAALSINRNHIAKYLRAHTSKMIFYADDVWTHISELQDLNALQMENKLGQISDAVIILIESPGTCTELGAFSLSPELRRKLLLIVDKRSKRDPSFINSGPIRWVNQESDFRPVVYADFSEILAVASEIDERLQRIPPLPFDNVSDIANRPRYLLFLLLDLLSVITPAPEKHIDYYLQHIISQKPVWSTISLLGLGVALRLISHFSVNNVTYYRRTLTSKPWSPFLHKDMFSIEEERAILLNTLDTIPAARDIIERMRGDNI